MLKQKETINKIYLTSIRYLETKLPKKRTVKLNITESFLKPIKTSSLRYGKV